MDTVTERKRDMTMATTKGQSQTKALEWFYLALLPVLTAQVVLAQIQISEVH